MSDFSEYLSGKVRKQSLPIFSDPTQVAATARKRLRLAQGELAQIYNEPVGVRYIAYIELSGVHPRGNHYHQQKEEWLYLLRGRVRLAVEDLENHERAMIDCEAGDLVVIAPRVAHALHPQGDGMCLEFSPQQFDPADTIRYMLG